MPLLLSARSSAASSKLLRRLMSSTASSIWASVASSCSSVALDCRSRSATTSSKARFSATLWASSRSGPRRQLLGPEERRAGAVGELGEGDHVAVHERGDAVDDLGLRRRGGGEEGEQGEGCDQGVTPARAFSSMSMLARSRRAFR